MFYAPSSDAISMFVGRSRSPVRSYQQASGTDRIALLTGRSGNKPSLPLARPTQAAAFLPPRARRMIAGGSPIGVSGGLREGAPSEPWVGPSATGGRSAERRVGA